MCGTASETVTSLSKRAARVRPVSFAALQQNAEPAEFKSLAYLMFPRLMDALDTLSAQFPVGSATGMPFEQFLKASPMFFHSSSGEMEMSQLKPYKPETHERQPPPCAGEEMNRPAHAVRS